MITTNKPASALDVERYLRGHGFTGHPQERTWYTNDHGARVVLRHANGGPGVRVVKVSVYVYDRATGDGWQAHLDSPPLWAVAAMLEGAARLAVQLCPFCGAREAEAVR